MTTFSCIVFLLAVGSSTLSGLKNITARPGQNVSLTCEALGNNKTITLEWSRPDLGGKCVFLYRPNYFHQDDQHESFRNRVFLQDIQMKNGDLSVILKNVTPNDNGSYECKIKQQNDPPGGLKLICTINLLVSPSGNKDGAREVEKPNVGVSLGRPGPIALPSVLVAAVLAVPLF
ncbi:hypothetical protein OJAV_G00212240 [Oryzias javanicus]|uniref:Ig-like domain-containing protein n=1 Tax=Oryzias javanicus TaxID=123683 RepID=A0A3S2TWG9_ORYJA|nr:hypothetical protein OJAV_G00212240 [Oryzias javanicus]